MTEHKWVKKFIVMDDGNDVVCLNCGIFGFYSKRLKRYIIYWEISKL
jgi:hypothetical protein